MRGLWTPRRAGWALQYELGVLGRAVWALIATDAEGKLISAAHWAVPVDFVNGQSSRDGEDYNVCGVLFFAFQHFFCFFSFFGDGR